MMSIGILFTCWEGWDCTLQYLAQPVSVEEDFINIAQLPPVQLSICRIFGIEKPAFSYEFAPEIEFMVDEESLLGQSNLPSDTLPILANSTTEFWNKIDRRGESYRLTELIKIIEVWNDSATIWNLIYENTRNNSDLRIDMGVYPFEGNSTLLCHTFYTGLADYGYKFRLVTTAAVDSRKLHFSTPVTIVLTLN
jgi:hypothetical protein